MYIINKEKFIAKALETHGIRYNYDQVVYINTKTKVLIGCPIHGYFYQKPNSHLQGQGCPKCAAEKRGQSYALTTEEFIAKARAIHGDYYDYSETVYLNTKTKVTIICPIHGKFTQMACEHIRGLGCQKCAYALSGEKNRSNTEEFIKKARVIHGDRYDYSKSVYVNNYTKLVIICPVHGEFEQIPNTHLLGKGCIKCGRKIKLTLEDFIKKATIVHGDLYDYSKSVYVDNKTPIEIICKKHGSFFQIPGNHTQGSGCPFCMTRVIVDTAEFIERARARHGDLYDYSKSVFVDGKSMVIIGCKKHGDFEQAASEHIRGRGCQLCSNSKGELAIAKILKKYNIEYEQEYTIPDQLYKFRYDFYIPSGKILIEYNGPQHYIPVKLFGGLSGFNTTRFRDAIKRDLAKYTKHRLIVIPYDKHIDVSEEKFENYLINLLNKYLPSPIKTT